MAKQDDTLNIDATEQELNKRTIALDTEISDIERDSTPMVTPKEFDTNLAMELANLIQVAYRDYELFEAKDKCSEQLLQPGTYFCLDHRDCAKASSYSILYSDKAEDPPGAYKVLDIFYYTSYNFLRLISEVFKPNTSRYGFIAKRGNNIYVVLRGTRELAEWVNNSQYALVPFLTNEHTTDDSPLLRIHSGYCKMYTNQHLGPFRGHRILNSIFSLPGKAFRALSNKCAGQGSPNNYSSMHNAIQNRIDCLESTRFSGEIIVTGHSLGGALASIAALHIGHSSHYRPHVYTFASPRVGNTEFTRHFRLRVNTSFRIANTEDIVPTLPTATLRLRRHSLSVRSQVLYNKVKNLIAHERDLNCYEHLGSPAIFTFQAGNLTSNHSMSGVYSNAMQGALDRESQKQ